MAFMRSSKGSKSITVEKEGYLYVHKKNPSAVKPKEKAWQQKYVVLRKAFKDGSSLEWYENFEAFLSRKNSSKLKLDTIDYIGPVDMGKDFTYAFILFGNNQSKLQLAAKSDTERSDWIKALNHCHQNGRPNSNSTSPTSKNSNMGGYLVKLKGFNCATNQDSLLNCDSDYVMIVCSNEISLMKVDGKGEQVHILSWLLENIKSYDSRSLDQNPKQKLLLIDTGRSSSTGQGTFHFVTPLADEIKSLIRLNIKKTYIRKKNSQDNINLELSSSPEIAGRDLSSYPRIHGTSINSWHKRHVSKEGPIPFHKYDSPVDEGYAHYIQQQNGYIDIFTDQRKVEENRKRHNSRTTRVSSSTQDGYIKVLPEESHSEYVDVIASAEQLVDSSHPVDVLTDVNIAVSQQLTEDYPAYVQVLGEDDLVQQSRDTCVYHEESHEMQSSKEVYLSREEAPVSRDKYSESRDKYSESREEYYKSSCTNIERNFESQQFESSKISSVKSEVHVSYDHVSRELSEPVTRDSTTSVNSRSPRWPQSITSQTSVEFSSLSSENDVFQSEINVVSEVFQEESLTTVVVATNSDALPTGGDERSAAILTECKKSEKSVLKSDSTWDVNKNEDMNESQSEISPNADDSRSMKARSWHNDDAAEVDYISENSTSTSESEHARDSHEFSEDDVSDSSEQTPRSNMDARGRSHTAGEVNALKANGKKVDLTLLRTFELSLTNPQHFNPSPKTHQPLTREPQAYTQDQVIFQLENPIQGVLQLPNMNSTKASIATELKYICSNCGWHKRSKKRSSLKPTFRSKLCPNCNSPVTRQDSKTSKSKDKSPGGGIFDRFRGKRRSSDEKIDKRDPIFMKPERPTATGEPLFIKRFGETKLNFGRHSPSLDLERSARGIAPSPHTAHSAVSLDAGESRVSVSCDDGYSLGKSPLATSFSDSATNGSSLAHRTHSISPSPQGMTASKCVPVPLSRTKSSPLLSCSLGKQDSSEMEIPDFDITPRKNSGTPLPPLPEVEDVNDPNFLGQSVPGTPPPMLPPRPTRPPLPPRHGSCPVVTPLDERRFLKRSQTDPSSQSVVFSPQLRERNRANRTLPDPAEEDMNSNEESIRSSVSLSNLLDDGNGEALHMKVVSLSLGDGLDKEITPPPLPPRRTSTQANLPPPLPRKISNEGDKSISGYDSPTIEARRASAEGRPPLPERNVAGVGSPKQPLSSKRSLEARRDFQTRGGIYHTNVSG